MTESQSMTTHLENAAKSIAHELTRFAETVEPEYREDFFHPCNRDQWVTAFCEWLSAKQEKSAAIRASND